MKVWALWNGGSSYSPSGMDELEVFESIQDARNAMEGRIHGSRYPQRFTMADGTVKEALTPCVEGSWMDVFKYDPREVRDPYPDFRFEQTERDAVRRVHT